MQPAAPTSATPVTLIVQEFVTCPPPPVVTRSGNTFTVNINPGPCLTPPVLGTFTLPVGQLEPGDYEVVVNPPQRTGYTMFFVRDVDAGVFVQGQSVGPTSGGTEVILSAFDTINCFGPDLNVCPLPTVTFNGVPATVVQEKFVRGTLAVITPANAKGIADVVVAGSRATKHGRVFRYYDPAEAPPSTMFERVLVPIYAFGPGGFGSNWTTEVMLLNNTGFTVEPYRRLPARIPARSTVALDFGASRPGGVLFFPPRESSSELHFGSLVRDTSRQADDWGTEVRVVRENELRTGSLILLNVPFDPRFRLTLRIYDPDSVEDFIHIWVYSMETGGNLADMLVPLRSANRCRRFEPCASDDPASAMLDLVTTFPQIAGQERVRVEVFAAGRRLWAFLTVTNNQTQHVTVITAQ